MERSERVAAFLLLAELRDRSGDRLAAGLAFASAVELGEHLPDYVYRRALVMTYENEQWDSAAACGEQGLRRYPDDATLLGYLGLTLNRTEPDRRGLALVKTALRQDPDLFGSFYRDYPGVMRRAGTTEEGIGDLEAAVARLSAQHGDGGPALGSAAVALADLLSATGRTQQLVALLDRVLSQAPQFREFLAPFLYRADHLDGSDGAIPSSEIRRRSGALLTSLDRLLSGSPEDVPAGAEPAGGVDLDLAVTQEIEVVQASADEATSGRLTAAGLSRDFIAILRRGAATLARETRARVIPRAWHDDDTVSDRVKDILDTVTIGKKAILSPFSGHLGYSTHMLATECFFYEEAGRQCLVLQWSHTDAPAADTAWFFPKERLLVVLAETNLQRAQLATRLRDLLQRILERPAAVREHLSSPCKAILVGEFECPHIGHYIWNCISGWSPFFRYGGGPYVDGYVVNKGVTLLGSVGELFKDQASVARGGVIEIAREAEGSDLILERKALLLTIKDQFISADLAERVIRWSNARCSEAFHRRLRELRASAAPLVLVTVRLDNRAWVEQADGWVALVSQLRHDCPRLRVVVDGGNSGLVQGWTHAFMSTEAEKQIASRLVSSCGGPDVICDSIGCSVAESIVLATQCDFFIAPVGAGMAKYRWIANLPGVAFSNSTFSQPSSFDGRLYDRFREAGQAARHVPAECIGDVEVRRGEVGRANFSMDWRDLHREVRAFIEQSGRWTTR